MTSDRPDNTEPDPGRRLMIVALVGVAVLAVAVLGAMGYLVWQRMSRDAEAAGILPLVAASVANNCNSSGYGNA